MSCFPLFLRHDIGCDQDLFGGHIQVELTFLLREGERVGGKRDRERERKKERKRESEKRERARARTGNTTQVRQES